MDVYTDVLVIGTGVSGLYSALNLKDNLNIIMISKGKIDECNTALAQGGISVARGVDDVDLFVEDTLKAGAYKNDVTATRILAEESIENIDTLCKMGFDFDRTNDGLSYTREGAHSINRIVHYKDKTGKELEETLLKQVSSKKNITIFENCTMLDILKKGNACAGALCTREGVQVSIHAKVTIMAAGGIGGLFRNSTNQKILTADGVAVALKNNIKVKNLNYIQFHPTAFFNNNLSDRKFLISESVRGEGGKLINCNGNRFVDELLPRDVVTKYIYEEERNTHCSNVYLDVTFMKEDFLKNRFPTIYEKCLENGINISKEPIPVSPAQHYFMGGIEVDTFGKTSMENLFAFGECSCTGVHGANRLASNSLLEALVFSKRGARKINNDISTIPMINLDTPSLDYNEKYYKNLNNKIFIESLVKVRGDIKNELVNC
ncbi:L-aspartate oxidase [Clostridium sp. P21]|uniref:L-aspartate oxidase n=1 Tax=Clostridium muellerianum TaxID=2716538 RepID=A0A7Y0EJP4_9CLOT|nr:L-aspartate oxidase [Clostridium muellerianum]NMM64721.1 L-aspartate oxidase [Clostridium muellerianum]